MEARNFKDSLLALKADPSLTKAEKTAMRDLAEKYRNQPINKTLEELAEECDMSPQAMYTAMRKFIKNFYIHKDGPAKYRIAEYFWWIPEPGINEQTAMSRYVSRVSKIMRENGRRRASGIVNWKQGVFDGAEEEGGE